MKANQAQQQEPSNLTPSYSQRQASQELPGTDQKFNLFVTPEPQNQPSKFQQRSSLNQANKDTDWGKGDIQDQTTNLVSNEDA